MGKTCYGIFGKMCTAKELVSLLRRKKMFKRSKPLGFYFCQQIVDFKRIEVNFFPQDLKEKQLERNNDDKQKVDIRESL